MAEQSWRGGFSRLEQPAGSAGKKAIELPHREQQQQQQQQQDERRAEVPWTVLEESSLSERASEREGRTEMELAGRTRAADEGRRDLGRRFRRRRRRRAEQAG
ncbi:hypothetical protein TRV_01363 [Trichophyton verrucosum HKI 0517]|uniref:Uncharacterized protein n=1 Tax=Trichophyton verrucosum (strain HKI 0517) TaxID=663202 RepID=D4D2Q7_TRIVH|nr:uncharacterized protein TRV_01363 [Trichophyton verrucosum HKI 0517]EFE43864.1 hypothetical protein TRV_01363 [Trichophyton verrucosum HKI 0517]